MFTEPAPFRYLYYSVSFFFFVDNNVKEVPLLKNQTLAVMEQYEIQTGQ